MNTDAYIETEIEWFRHHHDPKIKKIEGDGVRYCLPEHDLSVSIIYNGHAPEDLARIESGDMRLHVVPHKHSFFVLGFVWRGETATQMEGRWHRMRAGDVFIIPPEMQSCQIVPRTSDVIYLNISTTCLRTVLTSAVSEDVLFADYFASYAMDASIKHALYFQNALSAPVKESLARCLRELHEKRYLYVSKVRALLVDLLIELARTRTVGPYSEKMQQVIAAIVNQYPTVTIEKLAAQFHYSREYLSDLIRTQTGRTFQDWHTGIRLANGQKMLQSGQMTVEQVALAIGYTDKSSFYKAYKRKFGCTPRQGG